MPLNLVLGVEDVPYTDEGYRGTRIRKRPRRPKTATTGDVAEFLEHRYHVIETFLNRYRDDIWRVIGEDYLAGRTTQQSEQTIQEMFRTFLDRREMDGEPGVPTEASKGYTRRDGRRVRRRASFVDTGLYRIKFRAVMELVGE